MNVPPRSRRELREFHGATHGENAVRLLALSLGRDPMARAVIARQTVRRLPSLVLAEAQQARAAAEGLNRVTCTPDEERDYRDYIERAEVLERWSRDCEFPPVQEEALVMVARLLKLV